METKEDRLLALVGLLAAGLITVVVLFVLTWLSDVRRSPIETWSETCAPQTSTPSEPHSST